MCKPNDRTTTSDDESTPVLQDTPVEDIPNIVTRVAEKAKEWKAVPVAEKITLLEGILQKSIELREEWFAASSKSREIDASQRHSHGWAMGEVEITGPVIFGSYCNGILKTLKAVAKTNKAPPPRKVRPLGKDGHVAVSVYPDNLLEFTETVGLQGELILKPTNKESQQLQATYESYAVGGTAGILGAGNYDMPGDLLSELFVKGRVAIYKPNPVVQNSAPVLQKIFGVLVEKGFLEFIIGGAAVGSALVQHPALDEVVLTGSVNTFQKIQPLVKENNTPVCAELGSVNPWIIVPGPKWNKGSVNGHARALAFAKLLNNGHICAAPQVILVAKDWKWRNQFMKRLKYWLAQHPGSPAFYPGADDNHEYYAQMDGAEEVLSESLKAEQNELSTSSFGKHSRQSTVVISDIDGSLPSAKEEGTEELPPKSNLEVLTREAFCPVLAEVALDVSEQEDAAVFLKAAVEYAETKLFGSLTACILMDDRTTRRKDVEQIIADMKFGAVGINVYPVFCYPLPQLMWGAFPGQTESGQGIIGNCCLYEGVEKAILKAPFTWIGRKLLQVQPSASKGHLVFQRMATYKMKPSLMNQTKLFSALFLGM